LYCSDLPKSSRLVNIIVLTIALLLVFSAECDRFFNRRISSGRREAIAAIQPRCSGFVTVLQIPCSASEQDKNSLFRTLLGTINSLFQWERGPATVGLQSGHLTEITAVFGADGKMAVGKIP
jgi:hypothetical protein